MFKPARWRSEKNRIKIVFKLQFHVTQLSQFGGDALIITIVPADVGKPTSRLDKVKVRDGSCYWEKPLYETVKFSQDPKTGKFHEKIYHFIVAKDSSRFGCVGEVSVDFASYAETSKLSSLSLPLKNANSSAILHVSIQRVQGSSDKRGIDGIENDGQRGQSLRTHFGNGDLEGNIITEDTASIGSDIMLLSSESSSGINTPRENEPNNSKLTHESSITKDKSSQWDWLNGSDPKLSTDDDSTTTLGETSEEGSSSDAMIRNLEVKVAALTRQANVSELELQTLRKQIVKEMKKSQDLVKEVVALKEERNSLKDECEKLNSEEVKVKVKVNSMLLIDQGDPWTLVNELRQELNNEKDLSSNLRLQLQETKDSNNELIRALEKSKSKSKSKYETDDDEEQRELEAIVKQHSDVKEIHLLEQKIINLYSEVELYKRDKDDLETHIEQLALDYEIVKQENHDLCYKLERSQLHEQLKMQYECTSSYTELESQIETLENDLNSKSNELEKSNRVINELESYIKNLEQALRNQAREFETDLEELTRSKTEQEQRAIRAEDNLRKTKLENAKAATRLQEELKRISQKMAYTFEVNGKAAMKAIDETNKLRVEKKVLEDTLLKVKQDLRDFSDHLQEKLVFLNDRLTLKMKQLEKIKNQVENMSKSRNLDDERSRELATDCSENLFLQKEKDLQLEIEDLERKLDVLAQKTKNSQ